MDKICTKESDGRVLFDVFEKLATFTLTYRIKPIDFSISGPGFSVFLSHQKLVGLVFHEIALATSRLVLLSCGVELKFSKS